MKLELSGYPVSVAGNIVRNVFLNFTRRVDKEILGAGGSGGSACCGAAFDVTSVLGLVS